MEATVAKKAKKEKLYPQAHDGDWIVVSWRGFKEQCCDCGLVHKLNFRIVKSGVDKGRVAVQVFRDARATAAVRRGFKFEKEDKS